MDERQERISAALYARLTARGKNRSDLVRALEANAAAAGKPKSRNDYVYTHVRPSGGRDVSAELIVAAADICGIKVETLWAEMLAHMVEQDLAVRPRNDGGGTANLADAVVPEGEEVIESSLDDRAARRRGPRVDRDRTESAR